MRPEAGTGLAGMQVELSCRRRRVITRLTARPLAGSRPLRHENRHRHNFQRSHALSETTPRLADRVWQIRIADERRLAASLGGQSRASLRSSEAGSAPSTSSSNKSLPGSDRPQLSDSAADDVTNTEETRGFVPPSDPGKEGTMPSKCDEQIPGDGGPAGS
jgi:hypothetical protein